MKSRIIYKTNTVSKRELKDLLQAMFVAELLNPSKYLWIISPWMSNIELIDNTTGAFNYLEPNWPKRIIRLIDVIKRLLELDTTIIMSARADNRNHLLFEQLMRIADDIDRKEYLIIRRRDILHIKGIIGDKFYLAGSMNYTNAGIEIWEESITFETDEAKIASSRIEFRERYLNETKEDILRNDNV
jgi:hypothetical protein